MSRLTIDVTEQQHQTRGPEKIGDLLVDVG